jgi:hypothetical protein
LQSAATPEGHYPTTIKAAFMDVQMTDYRQLGFLRHPNLLKIKKEGVKISAVVKMIVRNPGFSCTVFNT